MQQNNLDAVWTRSCDQGRRKNDAFTHSAMMPIDAMKKNLILKHPCGPIFYFHLVFFNTVKFLRKLKNIVRTPRFLYCFKKQLKK